jgi:hypothetical protein
MWGAIPTYQSNKGVLMFIFSKNTKEWKALELYYRREWICFSVGFVLGALIF